MLSFSYIMTVYSTGIIIGLALLFFYELCVNYYVAETRLSRHQFVETSFQKSLTGYLVNSPSCKIPDLNPFDISTSKFVRREHRTKCYSHPPLTEIVFNPETEETYLQIKHDAIRFYTSDDTLYCCIAAIHPMYTRIQLRTCDNLSNKTWILNYKFQLSVVTCYDSERSPIYENLHATVVKTNRSKRRSKVKQNRLNVLVLGLDSMSRLNLYRTMPRTVTYLHTHGWTELRGYTKVADNTLPNLMALLAGIPPEKLRSPHRRYFDGYPFIWKEFAAAGYVTAYVEDNLSLGTFDCHLKGFLRRPTDYYPFTFFNIAENYVDFRKNQSFLGFKSPSDHLFGYLLDFARVHSKDPFFGLFWVNDFSHNNLNRPSSADGPVLETLQRLEQLGTLNTTMVLFLSDHGLRIGNFRKTLFGWYEDRLPFSFISIPEWYKSRHDKDFSNLLNNADKLVSPFDVYKTLSHVLHGDDLKEPIGCKSCHSLLTEIPSNRSCSDAGVAPHWCACEELAELPVSSTKHWADLVIRAINAKVERETDLQVGFTCAYLSLRRVLYFRKKVNSGDYVIAVETDPGGAQLEFTIIKQRSFEIVESSFSRLNEYGLQGHCAMNPYSKLFCYCVDEEADYY